MVCQGGFGSVSSKRSKKCNKNLFVMYKELAGEVIILQNCRIASFDISSYWGIYNEAVFSI
ncbi:hypothetical protein J18TS1_07410 [Oceanobacillus oncorhynchi subsp. incaldanensis]|nr:hypothetical protein J18TS1_07410 [Oceanobacillus oncorhynchi subsp. incaldanensis]